MSVSTPDDSGAYDLPSHADLAARQELIRLKLEQLVERVGRAPDDATGQPGSGMAGTLAELRRASRVGPRRVAGAAGGVYMLVEVLKWALDAGWF